MPRLFIAVDLTPPSIAALMQIQPPPSDGLRLAKASQMHVTLHFIGEAQTNDLIHALIRVQCPKFPLTVRGVGKFPPRGAPTVLWAGIEPDPRLITLHAAIADVLQTAGFPTETRPFAPHVTLARCTREIAPGVVEDFLQRNDGFSLPRFTVTEFHLYSSVPTRGAPQYHCERSFLLSAAELA